MAYPSESQESWNVLLLLQNRFFILEITIELAHKFQLLWGIEKKTLIYKNLHVLLVTDKIFLNAEQLQKNRNITSVGSHFGGQRERSSKFNC